MAEVFMLTEIQLLNPDMCFKTSSTVVIWYQRVIEEGEWLERGRLQVAGSGGRLLDFVGGA